MNDYRELHELYHHGIKGQRWGVRRYQNPDGSLTPAGKKRYHVEYDSWTGQTKVVDQEGKRISGGEKAFFENEMKQRARNDAKFNEKYIQYKQTQDRVKASNAHDAYYSVYGPKNFADMALYDAFNGANDAQRRSAARQGKQEVDKFFSDFANSYLDEVAKELKKG